MIPRNFIYNFEDTLNPTCHVCVELGEGEPVPHLQLRVFRALSGLPMALAALFTLPSEGWGEEQFSDAALHN